MYIKKMFIFCLVSLFFVSCGDSSNTSSSVNNSVEEKEFIDNSKTAFSLPSGVNNMPLDEVKELK